MTDLPADARPTSAARTTLSRIMTAIDTNQLGTVHGGVIMNSSTMWPVRLRSGTRAGRP